MKHEAKIIFLGTSEFAIPSLDTLINAGLAPLAVITAPDSPAGRGQKMEISPVKKFLEEKKEELELIQPKKLDSDFLLQISNLRPDLGIIASYGKILPKALLDIFPKGLLNIHPSLLPKYRGPSPIQSAILNGDEKTGVTIILVDEKMDHGPILAQRELEFPISNTKSPDLHDALAKLGAELLLETLSKWVKSEIIPQPQDESQATYTKLLKKEDGLIDWQKSPEYIERIIRAYNPWPGTYIKIPNHKSQIPNKSQILKIKKIKIENSKLKILVVQPEGKKEMTYEEFLRGHKNFVP